VGKETPRQRRHHRPCPFQFSHYAARRICIKWRSLSYRPASTWKPCYVPSSGGWRVRNPWAVTRDRLVPFCRLAINVLDNTDQPFQLRGEAATNQQNELRQMKSTIHSRLDQPMPCPHFETRVEKRDDPIGMLARISMGRIRRYACHCVTPGHEHDHSSSLDAPLKDDNDWVDLGHCIRWRKVSNERLVRVETPGGNMQLSTLQLVLLTEGGVFSSNTNAGCITMLTQQLGHEISNYECRERTQDCHERIGGIYDRLLKWPKICESRAFG
jgi:hypothetical protein